MDYKILKNGKFLIYAFILIFLFLLPIISSATLVAPYDTAPFTTDIEGNSAGRDSGGYFQRPELGYTSFNPNTIVWVCWD